MSDDEDDDELVQVSHLVSKEHRKRARQNTEHGGISPLIREVYRLLAMGGSEQATRIKLQLQKVRDDREHVESRIDTLEDELAHLREREDELESRIDDVAHRESEFEALIETLEGELEDGASVFPAHGKVQRATEYTSMTAAEVVDYLRERNPDIPEWQFVEGSDARIDRFGGDDDS